MKNLTQIKNEIFDFAFQCESKKEFRGIGSPNRIYKKAQKLKLLPEIYRRFPHLVISDNTYKLYVWIWDADQTVYVGITKQIRDKRKLAQLSNSKEKVYQFNQKCGYEGSHEYLLYNGCKLMPYIIAAKMEGTISDEYEKMGWIVLNDRNRDGYAGAGKKTISHDEILNAIRLIEQSDNPSIENFKNNSLSSTAYYALQNRYTVIQYKELTKNLIRRYHEKWTWKEIEDIALKYLRERKTSIDFRDDYSGAYTACMNNGWLWKLNEIFIPLPKRKDGLPDQSILILQYDLSGKFIKEWKSAQEANNVLFNGKNNPSKVFEKNSRSKTIGGFMWRKKINNEIPQQIEAHISYDNSRPILQFDLNGKLVKEHKSIAEAARFFDFKKSNRANIQCICKNKSGTFKGYQWRYKIDNLIENIPPTIENKRPLREVYQYDLNGKLIDIWKSRKEIQERLGYNAKGIARCCSGDRPYAYGYVWKYNI